jgi:D-glucosaminate-6-phosphate ammonia-lyase
MDDPYVRLKIPQIVNAKGPSTRLSGAPMRPEVAMAMARAAQACVDIVELHARAAEIIAGHTGAESGLVTSGGSAALLLGTAACVAGLDPAAMARLPDTSGLANEVVVVRSQRNQYDHAVRAAGVRLVEVGLPDRVAGAGVRDAEAWEIEAALSDATAAVLFVAGPDARPPLPEIVRVAHSRSVPVIVDAAAQLPPRANLKRFIAEGADLVAFSGGKAIGGPQGSGILCGRRDLVSSAALQMLDMDYPAGRFTPPISFIDAARLHGLPPHGIGRSCKVGKEQIIGLLTALELFARGDEAAERALWLARLEEVMAGMGPCPGVAATIDTRPAVPRLLLDIDPETARLDAGSADRMLAGTAPRIETDPAGLAQGRLMIAPACLLEGDAALIGRRLREIFAT